ncbi:MAG: hypothetical protein RLZZ299_3085 [Pseudomonadota bacterium]
MQGAAPGVGQSTAVLGLAIAWASLGRRVVILDLDPTEDLARLLHVGWALRPGNAHTLANALRQQEPLVPASSLLPGISIGSLGRWPGGHPGELSRAWRQATGRDRTRITSGWHDADVVLVDLPAAAGMPGLASLADFHLLLVPMGATLDPRAAPDALRVVTRWRDDDPGAGAWLEAVGYPSAGAALAAPSDAGWLRAALPELRMPQGAWDVIDGRVGEDADQAFQCVARELDARGAPGAT